MSFRGTFLTKLGRTLNAVTTLLVFFFLYKAGYSLLVCFLPLIVLGSEWAYALLIYNETQTTSNP
jgi:membrane protease YdiL (CAAX protease family)